MSRSFHAEVKKFSGIWCMYFVSMGENQSLVNNICLVRNNYVLVGNIIFSMSKKKYVTSSFWLCSNCRRSRVFAKLVSCYTPYSKFVKFVWFDQENKGFSSCQQQPTQALVLFFQDFSLPFILYSDVIVDAAQIHLTQIKDVLEKAIYYHGMKFFNTEKKSPGMWRLSDVSYRSRHHGPCSDVAMTVQLILEWNRPVCDVFTTSH